MGKNYTVVVSEVNESGDEVTVIELRGPIEVLQQFAPTAVASVLGAPAEQRPATPAEQLPSAPAEQRPATPAEQRPATPAAPVSAVADFSDGNYGPAQPRPRKRRTKAEMEAERLKGQADSLAGAMQGDPEPVVTQPVGPVGTIDKVAERVEENNAYNPFG